MGKSKIEWCDSVWNPVIGCSKVSEGCENCYAERMACRLTCMAQHGVSHQISYMNVTNGGFGEECENPTQWNGKTFFRWAEVNKRFPGKNKRIFVCSMGDLFHESVENEWIDAIIAKIFKSAQHNFLILTKRPQRMKEYFCELRDNPRACERFLFQQGHWVHGAYMAYRKGGFLPNLWLGVSVENQKAADKRIPLLLQIPAKVRFVSCEPLLGEVDLDIPVEVDMGLGSAMLQLDWVIVGGESGPNARPMHPDWVRSLRNQCQTANVPFFFKQWGEYVDEKHFLSDACTWKGTVRQLEKKESFLNDTIIYKVGKKNAGRLLDGKEYMEFPV